MLLSVRQPIRACGRLDTDPNRHASTGLVLISLGDSTPSDQAIHANYRFCNRVALTIGTGFSGIEVIENDRGEGD